MPRSGIAGAQGGFILRYSQVLAGMNESSDKPWWGGFTCGPKCSIYLPKLEGQLNPLTFFFFLIFIGVELLYKAVMLSAVQKEEGCTSIPSLLHSVPI